MQTKLLLSLFLTFFLLSFLLPSSLRAAENDEQISTASAKESPLLNKEYAMPYPGMLPDSPLYSVKILRDKIISFLITDPQKKIEFYLLQANKGMQAGSMLVDKKNNSLAKETFLKAEHNMTLIPEQIRKLQAKPSNELFEELVLASQKHQEILSHSIKRSPGSEKKGLEQVVYFSKQNQATIEKYQEKSSKRWNEWN